MLFSCNPIGQLGPGSPGYNSRIVIIMVSLRNLQTVRTLKKSLVILNQKEIEVKSWNSKKVLDFVVK